MVFALNLILAFVDLGLHPHSIDTETEAARHTQADAEAVTEAEAEAVTEAEIDKEEEAEI